MKQVGNGMYAREQHTLEITEDDTDRRGGHDSGGTLNYIQYSEIRTP